MILAFRLVMVEFGVVLGACGIDFPTRREKSGLSKFLLGGKKVVWSLGLF